MVRTVWVRLGGIMGDGGGSSGGVNGHGGQRGVRVLVDN